MLFSEFSYSEDHGTVHICRLGTPEQKSKAAKQGRESDSAEGSVCEHLQEKQKEEKHGNKETNICP